MLFNDPSLSGNGSRSCATCHPGGASDGRAYVDGYAADPGQPGARDVPSLLGAWQTPPWLRDGSASSLREAIERMLEVEMRGGSAGPRDLDALEQYVVSLAPFDRRRVEADGTPVEPATLTARRGFALFASAKCELCHPPPTYARRGRWDVGTGKWAVPTLRGVSSTPPYGHDGRWDTLEHAVEAILEARGTELNSEELHQLLAYLRLL